VGYAGRVGTHITDALKRVDRMKGLALWISMIGVGMIGAGVSQCVGALLFYDQRPDLLSLGVLTTGVILVTCVVVWYLRAKSEA
jgi:hypothetical protein